MRTGPVSVLPCSHIIPVPRGDSRIYLYLFLLFEWKRSFLCWLLLSASAAPGKTIHTPLGLHLTNLQSKPCKSIQLEVNDSTSSCQLQTDPHPAESQSSISPDRELLSQRKWPWGQCDYRQRTSENAKWRREEEMISILAREKCSTSKYPKDPRYNMVNQLTCKWMALTANDFTTEEGAELKGKALRLLASLHSTSPMVTSSG